jgi:GGDEF domain-containing protein
MTKRLRLSQVTLLLYLAVVFNLERLQWRAGISGVSIHTFLYGMVAAAVVLLFVFPNIKRFSVYSFLFSWTILYFFLRFILVNDIPIYGGIYTFITITELAILLVAIALAYVNASDINNFEKFIEDVYLPNLGKRILKQDTATEEIKTEFIRSRRNQLPLSLLVIQPDVSTKKTVAEVKKVLQEVQGRMTGRFIAASLAKVIIDEARRTDLIISRGDEGPFFVLCLDTKMEGSTNLARRIQATASQNLGIPVSYGVASFPDEALTYEELVHRAEFQLKNKEGLSSQVIEATNAANDSGQKAQP